MAEFSATMDPGIERFARAYARGVGALNVRAIAASAEVMVSHVVLSIRERLNRTVGTGHLESKIQAFGLARDDNNQSVNVGSDVPYMLIHDDGGVVRSSRGVGAKLAIPNKSNVSFFSRFGGTNPALWPRDIPRGNLFRVGDVLRDRKNKDMRTNAAYFLKDSVSIPQTNYLKHAAQDSLDDIGETYVNAYNKALKEWTNEASGKP